jgi:hypothetical protein
MMERFWSIEEMNTKILTEREMACEKHFEANSRRQDTGRYEVRLPLSDSTDKLGDSYDTAKVKFLKLEQRLFKKPQLKKDFLILIPCIIDYIEINQPNALKLCISLFFLTMAPTCFGKTMPSSGSDYFPV